MRNEIRQLREERSLSQGALGTELGVSRQTVNSLETGRYDPSLPLAFTVARLFGLSIEEIFHVDDGPPDHPQVDRGLVPRDRRRSRGGAGSRPGGGERGSCRYRRGHRDRRNARGRARRHWTVAEPVSYT